MLVTALEREREQFFQNGLREGEQKGKQEGLREGEQKEFAQKDSAIWLTGNKKGCVKVSRKANRKGCVRVSRKAELKKRLKPQRRCLPREWR